MNSLRQRAQLLLTTANSTTGRWLLAGFCLTICFLSFYANLFEVAPRDFFSSFQHDSESLVLGRLIADERHLEIPRGARLAFSSVSDFTLDDAHIYQSHALVDGRRLPDLLVSPLELNDDQWIHGVGRTSPTFAVPRALEKELSKYVGREVEAADGVRRIVRLLEATDSYVKVSLTSSPLAPEKFGFPHSIAISGRSVATSDLVLHPYLSQYGLQGTFYSFLRNRIGLDIDRLHLLSALFLSVTIVFLAFLYSRAIGAAFAVCFFVSMAFSPWMVAFSRNLYWAPFLWFLPALFSALYYFSDTAGHRRVWLALIFAAFLAKCLCGYEYVSTIVIFAASIFAIDLFLQKPRYTRVEAIKRLVVVSLLGALSFVIALLLHAGMRGDTLLAGLKTIFESDANRHGLSLNQLRESPWEIIWRYTYRWHTDFIAPLSGTYFKSAIYVSIATLAFKFISAHPTRFRDLGLLVVFLAAPLSWFILAKGHSIAHQHMNYVLWYFGFTAACLLVSYDGLRTVIAKTLDWQRKPERRA